MKLILAVVVFCAAAAGGARAQGNAPDARAVIVVTENLFDAMRARDANALNALLHDDARVINVRQTGEAVIRSKGEWVRGIVSSAALLDERMFDPEVRIDGQLATLWARYTFKRDGRMSHCGTDAFQFVRVAAEWRLITLAFTTGTTGCESIPPVAAIPDVLAAGEDEGTR